MKRQQSKWWKHRFEEIKKKQRNYIDGGSERAIANNRLNKCWLTVHNEHNPLADSRRHSVGRDAQVGAHVQPVHFGDVEQWSLYAGNCECGEKCKWNIRILIVTNAVLFGALFGASERQCAKNENFCILSYFEGLKINVCSIFK